MQQPFISCSGRVHWKVFFKALPLQSNKLFISYSGVVQRKGFLQGSLLSLQQALHQLQWIVQRKGFFSKALCVSLIYYDLKRAGPTGATQEGALGRVRRGSSGQFGQTVGHGHTSAGRTQSRRNQLARSSSRVSGKVIVG